ncbi:MAG: response regulator transcription factor [Verrucomicrobia subdivision 3 bacterium]|nr:response regulator transcription factor [Limisphaerales bacterium]
MAVKTKVFIADDHPIFRHGLRQMIESDPRFQVVGEAGDGPTALAQIRKLAPDIAVIDVTMPKQGGLEVVRALRASRPPIACIMLTMHAEESTFNAAMDAGAQAYILKENAMEDVLLGLRAVASGAVYLSPTISSYLLRRQQRASALREKKTGLATLTPTERRILLLVAENKTNKEIAAELFISPRTVESHRSHICQKLELDGPHRLLQFAIEHRSEI